MNNAWRLAFLYALLAAAYWNKPHSREVFAIIAVVVGPIAVLVGPEKPRSSGSGTEGGGR